MQGLKVEYQFKPHLHWNYIPVEVFYELSRFYGDKQLRIISSK